MAADAEIYYMADICLYVFFFEASCHCLSIRPISRFESRRGIRTPLSVLNLNINTFLLTFSLPDTSMPKSLPSWDAQLPDVSKPPLFFLGTGPSATTWTQGCHNLY